MRRDTSVIEPRFDLAVVGLGYVGLPLVVAATGAGHRVLGFDVNQELVDRLNRAESHVEDIADAVLAETLAAGFVASADPARLREARSISICVPTPWREREPDMSYVEQAAATIGANLRAGQLVVLESTTYPGTTNDLLVPILEGASGLRAGVDFLVAYSPERIDPANPHYGLHNTPKLVAGLNPASTAAARALYSSFCGEVVVVSGTREAEMAKLLENTYRHVNIALVNEMAMICHTLGIDIWEVIRGAATKPFGFQSFRPGPGVGGHCIPVDPRYLAYQVEQRGGEVRTIESAQMVNAQMILHVVQRSISLLNEAGKPVMGARIVLAGVAYKPNVSDVRETPARHIASLLRTMGGDVAFVDPLVERFAVDGVDLPRMEDPLEAVQASDLTLVLAAHDAFDLEAMARKAPILFDTSGRAPRDFAVLL